MSFSFKICSKELHKAYIGQIVSCLFWIPFLGMGIFTALQSDSVPLGWKINYKISLLDL